MKRVLLILILLAAVPEAYAQLLPFRSYSIEKGLSEAVVNDMMQDDEGYLWAATSYGLNRFDGYRFENFYEENGLKDNKIHSLFQDREGNIWIGTGGGVNVFKQDSIYAVPELSPLNSSTVLEIFEDKRGDFWFATDGEGIWHREDEGNITQYLDVHGLAGNRVRDIVEDEDGTLWFGTRDGLTSLSDGNFRSFTEQHGLPKNLIRDLLIDREGTLWIATRGGLSKMQGTSFTNYTVRDGLINNRVQSLSPDAGDGLWIGTEEGVSHFSGKRFKNYSVEHGLSNNIIYSTLLDREENIWFGTFGGGISVFFGDYLKNYTVEEGLPNNVVTSITEDRSGNHWITTYGGGVSRFDGSSFTNYLERDGLVDNKVYTITTDHQNRLLIGTRWGMSFFEGERFYNFDESELPYRKIRSIKEDEETGEYWLGTYGEGVLKLKNNRFKQFTEQNGLAHNTVMSVEQTNDGSLWFATYGGVSNYREGEFINYTIREGLPNNGVLDILKDNDGNIWVSTFGGIATFNGGSFTSITPRDGLPNEVCYFITQDTDDIYWIGTKKGVVRFDYEAYRSQEGEKNDADAFKLYTRDQGLIANEMNAGAGFRDSRGNLWFGTVGGVIQLDPTRAKVNNAPPPVHITNVMISGEPVTPGQEFEVSSDKHNIIFEFIGISFTAPEQISYEYRLKGSGERWQKTSQRSVRYSALLPGEYTFELRARNSDGVWSERAASLSFTVLAPFWMQWWFVALVVIVILGIIAFTYNYYRVRKMVDIERMRVRVASDLHDDVGSALTEIALQSDFLQTTDVGEELKHSLEQIGTQSRKIVSSLDDIVWSIDARNDTLGDITDRMQDYIYNMLPDKEVVYEFEELDMDEKVTVPMKENLYLIFKEAVNNIAKHSNASKVNIILKNENGTFDLCIHDNGDGWETGRKTGQGLRNMKMRAKRIDADITFKNDDGFTVRVRGNGM